jgi:hypothetical protein
MTVHNRPVTASVAAFVTKQALLVLDDVWDPRDVAPFLFDSTTSRLMITTSDGRTAAALGADQQELPVLTWEQSLDMIALWSKCPRTKLPREAADIVRECGSLPLAVAMVGTQLRGNPDRWSLVLHKLQNADLDRIRQSFPEYPHPDLLRAIDVSMEALPEELSRRYLDFGVFPEDTTIPEAAAATLWGLDEYDTADALDQLVDLSLLTRDSGRRLRVHDLMLDYLRRRLGADSLTSKHRLLLDRYAQRCSGNWPDGPNDGYFFENLIWHLRRPSHYSPTLLGWTLSTLFQKYTNVFLRASGDVIGADSAWQAARSSLAD